MKNRNKTTKFPVARIKKIMQKDEEVGKVAQATPIVISKALELFLQLVVDEAARVTTTRGSKKVEAYHLCVHLPFAHPVSLSLCSSTRLACNLFPSSFQKARNRDD